MVKILERATVVAKAEIELNYPAMKTGKKWPSERLAELYESAMVAAAKKGEVVTAKQTMHIIGTVLDEFCKANNWEGSPE